MDKKENPKQILLLHGGGSFENKEKFAQYLQTLDLDYKKTKSWKDWLVWTLEENFEFIYPRFPNSNFADYEIWKLWLEKHLPLLRDGVIVIAHSLGTIFIMKYLLENSNEEFLQKFPKIKELHLIAPIVANDFQPENDPENTGTFTFDFSRVKDLQKNSEKIFMWHSTDDDTCSIKNSQYLKNEIPNSTLHTFSDKGHFIQSTFWELFDHLRKMC